MELLFSILFGLIGSAYIVYGKKAFEPWYIVVGFVLIIYPYFISSASPILVVGAALVLLPIAKEREWF